MPFAPETIAADRISLQVLLFLRSNNSFSVHDIARAVGQSISEVWGRIILLEKGRLIEVDKDGYKLSKDGSAMLLELGYNIPKAIEDKKGKKESQGFNVHSFEFLSEFFYWVLVPLILMTVAFLIYYLMSVSMLRFNIVITILVLLILIFVGYLALSFKKVKEYESLVIFRLGKCVGKRGPGPVLIIPFLDKPQSVDLRVKHQEVPHETCITQDNVQLDVDFVFYWKIQEPVWSITKVSDPDESIRLLATALLRAVIAHFKFKDVLNQRESINELLKQKINEISTGWGGYVTTMEIREIKPPQEIVDSMHKQVSAEWQREATVIQAEGEAQAARMLNEAVVEINDRDFEKIIRMPVLSKYGAKFGNVNSNMIDKVALAKERFRNSSDIDEFHLELLLPDLLSVQLLFQKVEAVVKAIDFVYAVLVVLYSHNDNLINEALSLMSVKADDNFMFNLLNKYKLDALLVVSSSYGSPYSFDFLGLGKILEILREIIKDAAWRGKYEKRIAELEVQDKEVSLEKTKLENNQMQIEIVNRQLDALEKINNLKLSQKQRQFVISAIMPKLLVIINSDVAPQLISTSKMDEKGSSSIDSKGNDDILLHK